MKLLPNKKINSLTKLSKKYTNGMIFSIGLIFSIALSTIPFFIREKSESINSSLSVSLSIISTVLTAATFTIAYLLYEKLSLDRRIMDKQADIVIQLVDFLKGKTFFANSMGYGYFIRPAVHQLESFNTSPNYSTDLNKAFLINTEDYEIFFQQLTPLIRSYWMPTEIKDKLQFFEIKLYRKVEEINPTDLYNNYISFGFNHSPRETNCIITLPQMTLASFILDLKSLVQTIEQWIQDRSSISLELRLWEPS